MSWKDEDSSDDIWYTTEPGTRNVGKMAMTRRRGRALLATGLLAVMIMFGLGSAHALGQPIVFADWSWDSAIFHNRVAAAIIEHGFGYEVDYLLVDTVPGMHGMRRGDIHISMEVWVDNLQDVWHESVADGTLLDLGPNFANAPQGWYVPTYVIEGDPERGIEPMAPDLRSVFDLPKYRELFKDPEDPRKGRFYRADSHEPGPLFHGADGQRSGRGGALVFAGI